MNVFDFVSDGSRCWRLLISVEELVVLFVLHCLADLLLVQFYFLLVYEGLAAGVFPVYQVDVAVGHQRHRGVLIVLQGIPLGVDPLLLVLNQDIVLDIGESPGNVLAAYGVETH